MSGQGGKGGIRTPAGRLLLPAGATLSDAWHDARRSRVGGSEVAALLGLSPWASWFSLWWQKKGEWSQPELDEMRWGRLLERPIIDWFAHEHPEYVVAGVGTYVNTERDWQVCTPDALLTEPSRTGRPSRQAIAGLEAKCDRYDDGWGEPGTDQIPVHYRCQVLWQMDVTGLNEWHIAVLFGGSDYREYLVVMDDHARRDLELMRQEAQAFLWDLEHDVYPDIDDHSVTHQVMRDLHPDIAYDVNVEVPANLAQEYWTAYDLHKAAEANLTYYKSVLLDLIGDGRGALASLHDGRQKVAYRHPSPNGAPPHLRDWRPRTTPRTHIRTTPELEEGSAV